MITEILEAVVSAELDRPDVFYEAMAAACAAPVARGQAEVILDRAAAAGYRVELRGRGTGAVSFFARHAACGQGRVFRVTSLTFLRSLPSPALEIADAFRELSCDRCGHASAQPGR